MMSIGKIVLLLTFVFAFAVAAGAQIPSTPAGRQFLALQKALDSGDRTTIQDFLAKNMPFGRVEQALAMRDQSGGYDVKRVLESADTRLVILAQERGGAQQFVTITFNVGVAEPYQVAGIGIQFTQPRRTSHCQK
jgi:hypothetical protein